MERHTQVSLLFSFSVCALILTSVAAQSTTNSPSTNTSTPTTTITKAASITKLPGCQKQCGNLTIPYPFGIGSGCALEPGFEIDCDTSTSTTRSPTAFIGKGIQVYHISDAEMRISNTVARSCYSLAGALLLPDEAAGMYLGSSQPYSFSELNRFTVIGCDEIPLMTGLNFSNGCFSLCANSSDAVVEGRCMGDGCCRIEIPKGLKYFETTMISVYNHTGVWDFNPCGYAFLGEASRFHFRGLADLNDTNFVERIMDNVPIVLDWAIGNLTCVEAQQHKDYACLVNSQCVDSGTGLGGYRCSCDPGYEGNPYVSPGCQGNLMSLLLLLVLGMINFYW
ncbi:hypothetical protein HAX54_003683 [Datura stramonium]|uniref:EGF-like domain-containing protein n=1 Tax=Datura stramonium TaxID=4076 RepID=A0ABS8WWE2_DATST|nr:hypothetical protein [Datura stramonium]